MFANAAAGGAKHADRMCFIDQQPRLMTLLDLDDARQIDDVAIHAVEGFYDDKHVAVILAIIGEELVEVEGFGEVAVGSAHLSRGAGRVVVTEGAHDDL